MNSGTVSIGTGQGGSLPHERPEDPHECPAAETLAAYLDGTLDAAGRVDVERHVAACVDCRDVLAESSLALAAEDEATVPTPASRAPAANDATRRGARWFWPAVGALAAAAALVMAIVIGKPGGGADSGARPELEALVAAVGDQRPFEPRLTGGFRFGPLAPVMRAGGRESVASSDVRIAAAQLEIEAQERQSPEARAASAAGALVLGRTDEAIRLLQQVVRETPGRAAIWSDLAAAWLVRADGQGNAAAAAQALVAADRAIALAPTLPEALFNRALALERLGRRDEAVRAWRAVTAAEPDARWSEGRSQREP